RGRYGRLLLRQRVAALRGNGGHLAGLHLAARSGHGVVDGAALSGGRSFRFRGDSGSGGRIALGGRCVGL
ncbi:hypothetical protein AN220_27710, partial [Streptomyces nanshensis]